MSNGTMNIRIMAITDRLRQHLPVAVACALLILACLYCGLASAPIDDSIIYWLFFPIRAIGCLITMIWLATIICSGLTQKPFE